MNLKSSYPPARLITPHQDQAPIAEISRDSFPPAPTIMHPLEAELRAFVRDPVLLEFFERATDGLWMWDLTGDGDSYVTPAYSRTIGFEPGEFEHGAKFWQSRVHPSDWQDIVDAVEIAVRANGIFDTTSRMKHKDGHTVWNRSIGFVLYDEKGNPRRGFGINHDVTELMETRARLEKETRHDPLTMLLNRRGIDEALLRILQQVRRLECEAYAIVLDLDNFKAINDCLGHAGGDQVLVECAKCLTRAVRVVDECGRLGGDEFVVFLLARDRSEAEGVAHRVKQDLAQCSIEFENGPVDVTLSAALVPIYCEECPIIDRVDQLLSVASPYLRKAKSNGKNQISVQSAYPPPIDKS